MLETLNRIEWALVFEKVGFSDSARLSCNPDDETRN
jgi:hypothetical protein